MMKDRNLGHTEIRAVEGREGDLNRVKVVQERQPGRRFRSLLGFSLGFALVWSVAGCHKTAAQGQYDAGYQNAGDPADANLAGGAYQGQPAQVMGQRAQNESAQQAQDYQQGAPIERRGPDGAYYNQSAAYDPNDPNAGYLTDDQAQDIYESDLTDGEANEPPPPLPEYDQPPAPDPDYLWTPGYWAWGPYGYYWVPGCWVEAPFVGALWTPGYWAFYGGAYRFHHGYWGRHVGFYGGINYGFGYFGFGYYGGYWNGPHFYYNTRVNRIDNRRIRYVYSRDERGAQMRFAGGASYNGGPRGVQVRPRPAEIAVLREERRAPVPEQIRLRQQSGQNRQQSFNQNRGRPAITVDARPIASDHRMPAELPRQNFPARNGRDQRGFRQDGGGSQGQQQPQVQQIQPDYRRVPNGAQGQPQNRVQQQPQQAPVQVQPQQQPQQQPGFRRGQRDQQGQPQVQQQVPVQQQPQAQPVQPQYRRGSEGVQAQPQAAPQAAPQAQPQQPPFRPWSREQRTQPQATPQAQPQPQSQPQQDFRRGRQQEAPAPQAAPQAQPQPQQQPQFRRGPDRPQAQPQAAPAPQPRAQPQPAPQAAPQARPQGRPDHPGRGEEHKNDGH